MARPQDADGGTASSMESSLRIYFINNYGVTTSGGPPAWELGEVLTTPYRKNVSSFEMFTRASDLD